MAPQGGRTKGWPRLTNSFDLRKWWVRKSEYTWVRFGERRGPAASSAPTIGSALRLLVPSTGRSPSGGQSPGRRRPRKMSVEESRAHGASAPSRLAFATSLGQSQRKRPHGASRAADAPPGRERQRGGRHHFGTVGGVTPERWAASSGFRTKYKCQADFLTSWRSDRLHGSRHGL